MDVQAAQRGIVYLDEIDKLGGGRVVRHEGHAAGRPARPAEDDRGDGRQRPARRRLQDRRGDLHPVRHVATSSSSAAGPSSAWRRSSPGGWAGATFGFDRPATARHDEATNPLRHVLPEDLERFGLIPELLGRLPVIATLDDLGVEDLVRILREPKNSLIGQYRKLLEYHHADAGVHRRGRPGDRPDRPRAGHGGQGAAGGRRGGCWSRSCSTRAVGDLPDHRGDGAGRGDREGSLLRRRRHP